MKEKLKEETKVNEERNEDEQNEQNEPLDLSLKNDKHLKKQTSSQHNYSPISYTMDYVCCENETCPKTQYNEQNDNRKSNNQVLNIGRGKPFPTWMFREEQAIFVDKVPDFIDGQTLYKVHTTHTTWWRQTSDKRYFLMQTSSRSNYTGIREGGVCQGSWICPNITCPFKQTSFQNQPNHINLQSMRGNRSVKMCQICDTIGICEGCGAWKLLEYSKSDNIATVYHIGKHVCWVKPYKKTMDKKTNDLFEDYDCSQNLVMGKEMCINKVADYVSKGMINEARQSSKCIEGLQENKVHN